MIRRTIPKHIRQKVVWGVNPNLEGVYGLFHCMEIVGEKSIRQAAEYAQEEVKYIE